MDYRTLGSFLSMAVLLTGCFLADDDDDDAGFIEDPGLCFQTRAVTIPPELARARWLEGDLDADGRGDLVAIESGAEQWTLHPLYGSPGDVPFLVDDPVVIELSIPLDAARIVFADADGDGDTDLATYHQDRIFIVEGPLTGVPSIVETEIPGLSPARGEFVDFDEDGVLDFVMREGTGDDLVSYRGLPEGGFELAGSAEFHADTYCISQILAEDRDDDWFVVVGYGQCSSLLGIRVAAFNLTQSGAMAELAAQEFDMSVFDRDLALQMVGNLLGEPAREVLINDTIWAVESGQLNQRDDVFSTRRGDVDGDGIVDHVTQYASSATIQYGGQSDASRMDEDVRFVDLQTPYDSRELLEMTDVDGDGREDVTMLQVGPEDTWVAVGGAPVQCSP